MDSTPTRPAQVAVCPSAGIGHLTPFLRLASMLTSNSCSVTLIIIRPTLSFAEANQINTFLSTHPHITASEFHILPCEPSSNSNIQDPFLLQYDAVSRSAHLLVHHLATLSPPPSAVFSDLMFASGINKPLYDLGIPNYNVITSSARFFSFMTSLTHLRVTRGDDVVIPGLAPIVGDDIPPIFSNTDHMFTRLIETSCRYLQDAKGIVLNSFDFFEPESISALQNGKVLAGLPSVFPVGPFIPYGSINGDNIPWLDNQPSKSVVYVSFGSKTVMSKDQIREIGDGLERSGLRFLWVIKTTVVDKEDKEELRDLLSEAFFENTKERGLILREWVNQEKILAHPAIGGFLTHCGWNSVMEAAQRGIPLLAWPLHGDQRVNAGEVEKAGLGIWERSWGWIGERLVKGDEIAMKIQEMMTSEKLRASATRVWDEATKAWEKNGSSRKMFETIIGDKVST
ncbi:UDP-glycosyltransferase 708C2-like [Chenopodium quinoa]|uniref:Glycosyltransferase n=1 Tax=Chenopodium quinoa TaxID=63459 RepID=A0A803LSE1_CHEQI|nr:UDP-glycosyltransferase 708C2-like [Chenopodium quinoa]